MNMTIMAENEIVVVQALLWSISAGVFLVLCLMVAITYLLKKNHHQQGPMQLSARRKGEEWNEGKASHVKFGPTMSLDTDQYLRPRDLPTKSTRQTSPSGSLDHHIYDDPEFIQSCVKMGRPNTNGSDTSSSRESNNYEKVHDYANAPRSQRRH
ncbi:uncharacterized protein [Palaemon carinicauda]|uniref:uncharacterized protein isoform X2 n=1 Tax=Palaemon carinicauda TaxID=392227 RepID=UPI0035B64D24